MSSAPPREIKSNAIPSGAGERLSARDLAPDDILLMPEPVYYGGTTERTVTSEDIIRGVREAGRQAYAFATRVECGNRLLELAQSGDRLVIMGARDDTLAIFAADLLGAVDRPTTLGPLPSRQ